MVDQVTVRPRTSGAAVASVLFGAFGCLPISVGLVGLALGGVPAVAAGCFALAAVRPPVRGRGLAAVGVALGLASMVGWSVHFARHGIAPYAARHDAPDPAVARDFFTRLSHADVPGAAACVRPTPTGPTSS